MCFSDKKEREMKKLILLLFIVFISCSTENKKELSTIEDTLTNAIKMGMEYAYFEGQKDALEGDVRIKKVNGNWEWSKSPWDDTLTNPKYRPVKESNTYKYTGEN